MSDSMRPARNGARKPPPPSPHERILLMRSLTQATATRVEIERRLAGDASRACEGCALALAEVLKPLHGLPCRPHHFCTVSWAPTGALTCEVSVAADPGAGREYSTRQPLMRFTVHASPDASTTWVAHDDDRISLDAALDLATDAVERVFDLTVLETDEEEIPF